jgi:hypothetical protein
LNIKVKLALCVINEALRNEGVWGSECIDPHILDLALAGGEWSTSLPASLPPGKELPVPIGIGG